MELKVTRGRSWRGDLPTRSEKLISWMKKNAVSQILHLISYHHCAASSTLEKQEKGIFYILGARCTNNTSFCLFISVQSLNSDKKQKQTLLTRKYATPPLLWAKSPGKRKINGKVQLYRQDKPHQGPNMDYNSHCLGFLKWQGSPVVQEFIL